MTKNNFYITTPIYYVNSEPHIGSVYTTLMADVVTKFQKLNNKNVRLLTGTDEHGLKLQQSAEKAGVDEQSFVDKYAKIFQEVADYMNFDYNDFIRTTQKRHIDFVQEIWKQLMKNDWLYRGKYSGWYCVSDEAFYKEEELQKQSDGSFKTELGKNVEWREEESYFFRLSEFQNILLELYKTTDFVQPVVRRNEVMSFVSGLDLKEALAGNSIKNFLQDLSVSRNNFSWGIKIPVDDNNNELLDSNGNWKDNLKNEEKHVIYVWLDALFNYQSALEKTHDNENLLEQFWNNADVIHLVGKDIVKFHTVYWPAFLMAVKYDRKTFKNVKLNDVLAENILPKTVFAHGWWTNEGRKISKSFGNVINPIDEINWLQSEFSIDKEVAKDYFKYYLITATNFGEDGDYSRDRLIEKINAELVNNIGNLVQRVLSMIYKNFDGKIKASEIKLFDENFLENTIDVFNFQSYRDKIIAIANDANLFMEKNEPWTKIKNNEVEEAEKILFKTLESIIAIAVLLQPICPFIAGNILNCLTIKEDNRRFKLEKNLKINDVVLEKPVGFCPRLQKSKNYEN